MRAILPLAILLLSSAAQVDQSADSRTPHSAAADAAAPRRTCEITRQSWCVLAGSLEITKLQKSNNRDPAGTIWVLDDVGEVQSKLVVIEPPGCAVGFADTIEPLSFAEAVSWRDQSWDEMSIRLKRNESCDLRLRVPSYQTSNPYPWAFMSGPMLIAACMDADCGARTTLSGAVQTFRTRFKREDASEK